jgi:hypothetical protein
VREHCELHRSGVFEKRSEDSIAPVLKNGKGCDMKPFTDRLSDPEMHAVARYIRTLGKGLQAIRRKVVLERAPILITSFRRARPRHELADRMRSTITTGGSAFVPLKQSGRREESSSGCEPWSGEAGREC